MKGDRLLTVCSQALIMQHINTPSEEHEEYTNKQRPAEKLLEIPADTVITVSLALYRPKIVLTYNGSGILNDHLKPTYF